MRDFAAMKKHSGWIPPGLKNNKHHQIQQEFGNGGFEFPSEE